MDKSVSKRPRAACNQGGKKNTRRFLDLFWLEEGKTREEPGEKEQARGQREGLGLAVAEFGKANIWEDFFCSFSEFCSSMRVTTIPST